MSFAHLHVHSQYSLLDGFSDINKLVARVKELGMPAVALTDHGSMSGVVQFYNAAISAGIKPIIGTEAYLAPRGRRDRDAKLDRSATHLLLLAENDAGYKNLMRLSSASQLEGFYYVPRIDRELLSAHSDGVIVTSGCLSAEIPRMILGGRLAEAEAQIRWYLDVFGRDRFFVELQAHEIPDLETLNRTLVTFARQYDLNLVATNDVHYVLPEDAQAQDVLLALQTGRNLSDPTRMRMAGNTYYLRTPDEMRALFAETPDAVENTLLIADRCQVDLVRKRYWIPAYPAPDGKSSELFLSRLCQAGVLRRYGDRANSEEVQNRLAYELSVIHGMGFDDYFLIVWDLTRFAISAGIWYNARGSAAGSIVAYVLEIASVDPLEHGLYFERFLNPSRISMPDIDLDFQDDRRSEMLEYCSRKYGADHVAQIITFNTMASRASVRDVGRTMNIPLELVDVLAKLIPQGPGAAASIVEAIEQNPDLARKYKTEGWAHALLDMASQLEGTVRNAGTHAAGLIIAPIPLTELAPLHRPTSDDASTVISSLCAFDMSAVESMGLLKVDFLGLATLSVMHQACDWIRERHGVSLDLYNIPVDDFLSFELLGNGLTAGVFQVEGAGMRRYLREMKPKSLQNIVAMVALYRPGPLEFIPAYIRRLHGEEPVEYRHPALEPIFAESFGIPVYQEQIMRAAVDLAGYTLAESDELRKVISKKQKDKLAKHRVKFLNGAHQKGISSEIADAIFTDWENFARYGFNRAHAADYGVIAVQTAYLKAHYPLEYMAALLAVNQSKEEKVRTFVAECRRLQIAVLPPDVNFSQPSFAIEAGGAQPGIRFGLAAIKNVGNGPVDEILRARGNTPFADFNDFCRRVDLKTVGKRALESLVKAGGLDVCGDRRSMLATLEDLLRRSRPGRKGIPLDQIPLFDASGRMTSLSLPRELDEVDRLDYLVWERDLLGMYVSDHPLAAYMDDLEKEGIDLSDSLTDIATQKRAKMAGVVMSVKRTITKKGEQMAFVTIEDMLGPIELVIFPGSWRRYAPLFKEGQMVFVVGSIDAANESQPKLLVDHARPLADIVGETMPANGRKSTPPPPDIPMDPISSDPPDLSAFSLMDLIGPEDLAAM